MEIEVINNKNILNKSILIENCNSWKISNDDELLVRVLSCKSFDIKVEDLGKDGDVIFSISQKSLGLSDDDIKKYSIMRSNFFANFLGEFLVRKNINVFVKFLLKMEAQEYNKTVCGFNHKNFGMFVCVKNKVFRFQFHISLIQEILTEELNNTIFIKK